MASIMMWIGIALIVLGWITLSWQASKRFAARKELEKFPEKRKAMVLRSNYSRFTILIGIAALLVALFL